MVKRVAISQSNYIPWKGYFDFINNVDEFILYDRVQYTKRDWRNRNRIKTPHGLYWLTIPVSASRSDSINEVEIARDDWNEKHWTTIRHMYGKAPYFESYADDIQELYEQANQKKLSEINHHFLNGIKNLLGIKTPFSWSSEYRSCGNKSERLLMICKQANADVYVSGPKARDYLNTEIFEEEGIAVEWMDYTGYQEYPQLYDKFEHSVSILDLIFNTGHEAANYMKSREVETV